MRTVFLDSSMNVSVDGADAFCSTAIDSANEIQDGCGFGNGDCASACTIKIDHRSHVVLSVWTLFATQLPVLLLRTVMVVSIVAIKWRPCKWFRDTRRVIRYWVLTALHTIPCTCALNNEKTGTWPAAVLPKRAESLPIP